MARLFVRIGFGLALAFAGFAHYQDPEYAGAVAGGLGVLEPLGVVWSYILPGLMIIGGMLLAFGIYRTIAAYAASIALASIPAGLMLKSAISGIPLDATMPAAMNAFIWILVLLAVLKGSNSCAVPCGPCNCTDMPTVPSKPSAMKSAPVAPSVTMKAPVATKKPMPKKIAAKKATK